MPPKKKTPVPQATDNAIGPRTRRKTAAGIPPGESLPIIPAKTKASKAVKVKKPIVTNVLNPTAQTNAYAINEVSKNVAGIQTLLESLRDDLRHAHSPPQVQSQQAAQFQPQLPVEIIETESAFIQNNQNFNHVQVERPTLAAHPVATATAPPPQLVRNDEMPDHMFNFQFNQPPPRLPAFATQMPAQAQAMPAQPFGYHQHPRPRHNATIRSAADLSHSEEIANTIAKALTQPQVVNPGGKYPHSYIVRGPKRLKTGLAELKLEEYLWGLYELIRETPDPMLKAPITYHFEQVLQDSLAWNWEDVRAWSEEVFSRVITGKLSWGDRYDIDRLQTDYSHKHPLTERHNTASAGGNAQRERGLNLSLPSQVVQKRPGPPCKLYNQKSCNQATHHTYNGYRQVHVCSFCLWHKCLFLEHPEADCNAKNSSQGHNQGHHNNNGQTGQK